MTLFLAAWGCSSGSGGGGEGGGGQGGFGGEGGFGGFVLDACIGDHDQAIQCDNDMSAAMWGCYGCRLIGAPCPDGVQPRQTPIAECLNVALGLSFDCGTCYQAYSVCLIDACTVECNPHLTGDPESCRCVNCGLENCDDEFEACAKYRMSDGVPDCPGAPACTS